MLMRESALDILWGDDLYELATRSVGDEEEDEPVRAASVSSHSMVDRGVKLTHDIEAIQSILRICQDKLHSLYRMEYLYVVQLTNTTLFKLYLLSTVMDFSEREGLSPTSPTRIGEPIGHLLYKRFIEEKLSDIERDIEVSKCTIGYYQNRLEEVEAQKTEYLRERVIQELIAKSSTSLPVTKGSAMVVASTAAPLCIKPSGYRMSRTTLSDLGEGSEPTLTLHDFMLDVIRKSSTDGVDKSSRRQLVYETVFNRLFPGSAGKISDTTSIDGKEAMHIS